MNGKGLTIDQKIWRLKVSDLLTNLLKKSTKGQGLYELFGVTSKVCYYQSFSTGDVQSG
jgi:hypothetical protein